ncbi:MAG: hypothetical protein AB1646_17735 [Thermodesulfobacteriota bacterium]
MMRRSLSLVAVSFGAFVMVLLATSAWCEPSSDFIRVITGPPLQFGTAAGAGPGICHDVGRPGLQRYGLRPLGGQVPKGRRPRARSEFPATEVERAAQTDTSAAGPQGADTTGATPEAGAPAADAGSTSTGLDLSGGVGGTSINGLIAGSPRVATDSLGLNNGVTFGGRVAYSFGSILHVWADRNRTLFRSSDNYKGPLIERQETHFVTQTSTGFTTEVTYDSWGNPIYTQVPTQMQTVVPMTSQIVYLAPGDSVDTLFTVDTTALCARLDLMSLVPGRVRSPFSIGPEVQFIRYESDLRIDNDHPERVTHGQHGTSKHSMVGGGGFAALDFASFTNLNNPLSNSSFACVPRVKVAGSYGDGEGMRFYTWEVVLNVDLLFRRALRRNILNTETFFMPGLRTEVAYLYRTFDQYESKTSNFVLVDPHALEAGGPPAKQNNEFDQQSLTFRASVLF